MHPTRLSSPGLIGVGLCLAAVLVPSPVPVTPRDVTRDVAHLQQTECEFRGITSTFGELTRVYVLQTYEGGELLRWQAEPVPGEGSTELLVTAVFRVARPKDLAALSPDVQRLRQAAAPTLGVAWRLTTLAATRITAANDYASDALQVYRQTVNGFIGRMAVLTQDAALRQEPATASPSQQPLVQGTVLLLEPDAAASDGANTWRRVRLPSTAILGWVPAHLLRSVSDAR